MPEETQMYQLTLTEDELAIFAAMFLIISSDVMHQISGRMAVALLPDAFGSLLEKNTMLCKSSRKMYAPESSDA